MKNRQSIVGILLFLMPIVGMALDLIAPSLPNMAKDLHTTKDAVQNLISTYIMGYALGSFIIGFLSDAWGRRWLLRLNLFGFTLVSILPLLLPHISLLLLVRLVQGITIGASSVLARTILADLLMPEELIKMGATLGIMWGFGPVIGPVIGSYLQFYLGWQACFGFFALVALIELILIWLIIPETHVNRHPLAIKTIQENIPKIIQHRVFMGLVLVMGLMYSLVASFQTIGPFLVQNVLHYSALFFGRVALFLGIMFLISSFICRVLVQKFSVQSLFFLIINLFIIIATLNLVISYFYPHSIVVVIIASALMFFLCGFVYPLAMGYGMSLFRHIAGTASAIMFSNVLLSSFIAFCISFIKINTIISSMWIYFFLLVLSGIIYWQLIRSGTPETIP